MVKRTFQLNSELTVVDNGTKISLEVTKDTGQYGTTTSLNIELKDKEVDELIELLQEAKTRKKQKTETKP